jgi:hypothetical protein
MDRRSDRNVDGVSERVWHSIPDDYVEHFGPDNSTGEGENAKIEQRAAKAGEFPQAIMEGYDQEADSSERETPEPAEDTDNPHYETDNPVHHTDHPDLGERSAEGDYDKTGAERDRDRLFKRLHGLSDQVAELQGESEDLDSRVREIQEDITDLRNEINGLVEGSGGQSAGAKFGLVAQLSVIQDDAQSAAEESEKPRSFFYQLGKMFKGIWAVLWRLLSRFRAVKEWSLSGELGLLSGKVAVSVTFGPAG